MDIQLREFRQSLADVINRVAYSGERAKITRHGKGVVAIVSMDDLALLERAEDEFWGGEARKALTDMKRKREKPIPHERVMNELGGNRRRKAG